MALPSDLIILINGAPLTGWLEFKSTHHFSQVAGECELKCSAFPGGGLPAALGDQFQAILMGKPIITGFVHEVSGDDDWGHDIRIIHARDKTQDFHDSTLGMHKPPKPPASLQQLLSAAIGDMGLDLPVVDKVSADPFQQGEVPSPMIDETGFKYGDRLSRQRQALLNTDGAGNLVINQNMGEAGGGILFRGPSDSPGNNILKAKYHHSDLERHNQHAVNSQHSTNDKKHWQSKQKSEPTAQSGPISKEWGVCNDTGVRPQRRKHHRARHSLRRGKAKDAASWRANSSRARGFQYTATLQGYTDQPGGQGVTWWHGQVIQVNDYKYGISAQLFIDTVKFHLTWSGGSTTELTLTFPDAYNNQCGGGDTAGGRTSSYGGGAPKEQSAAPVGDLETVET